MNDELIRALAAQQQGQAQLPGLEEQLVRANALRDTPYNARGQYSRGGVGAGMGALANMMGHSTGTKQANALRPQLEQARSAIGEGQKAQLLHKYHRQQEQDQLAATAVEYDQGRDSVKDEQWNKTHGLAKARAAAAARAQEIAAAKKPQGALRAKASSDTTKEQRKAVARRAKTYRAMAQEVRENPYYLQPLRKLGIPSNKIPELLAGMEKGGWTGAVNKIKDYLPGVSGKEDLAGMLGISTEELRKYLIFQSKLTRMETEERHDLFGSALTRLEDRIWQDSRNRYPGMSAEGQLATLDQLANESSRLAQETALGGLGGAAEGDIPGWQPQEVAEFERFYSEYPNLIKRDAETGRVMVDPMLSTEDAYEQAKKALAESEDPSDGPALVEAAKNSSPEAQQGVAAAVQEQAAEAGAPEGQRWVIPQGVDQEDIDYANSLGSQEDADAYLRDMGYTQ